jgi:hypothetical protein
VDQPSTRMDQDGQHEECNAAESSSLTTRSSLPLRQRPKNGKTRPSRPSRPPSPSFVAILHLWHLKHPPGVEIGGDAAPRIQFQLR